MKTSEARAKIWQSTACVAVLLLSGAAAADLPLAPPPNPPAIPPPFAVIDFTALWSELSPPSVFYTASSLEAFEEQIGDFLGLAYNLDAFESWLVNGQRHYAGVFRQTGGDRELVTGLDAAAFETERLAQAALYRRLVDVEVELVEGVRVYSGLFQFSFANQQVHDGLTAAQLEAEIVSSQPTYRLALFDTWWENGELRSYSVFTSAPLAQTILIALPWDDFLDEAEDLADNGYRLIDIEITEVPSLEGGVDLFSGRFLVRGLTRDWLSACLESTVDLIDNDWLFGHGYNFTSVGFESDLPLGDPTHDLMGLLDLEVGRDWIGGTGSTPNLVKPIHDSGTPGPPRWP